MLALSQAALGSQIDDLLKCIKESRIEFHNDLTVASLKAAAKVPKAADQMAGIGLYYINLNLKGLRHIVVGGKKSSIIFGDFLEMGLSTKNNFITPKLVEKFVNNLDRYSRFAGRKEETDMLKSFFTKIDGEVSYLPRTKGDALELEARFLKAIDKTNPVQKYFLDKLTHKLYLSYNSNKTILQSIEKYKFLPQTEEEADQFINFLLFIDSKTQPTKEILLEKSALFMKFNREPPAKWFMSSDNEMEVFHTTYKKFLEIEDKRKSFHTSRLQYHLKDKKTIDEARRLAKSEEENYVNLRYTCKARGNSPQRIASSGLFRKYAFILGLVSTSFFYTIRGGFEQKKGFKIFVHNLLVSMFMNIIGPKIIMGRNFSNAEKLVNSYVAKNVGALIDGVTYAQFIETEDQKEGFNYEKFFKDTNMQEKIKEIIDFLEQDEEIRAHLAAFNKIPQEQLTKENIEEFMLERKLDPKSIQDEDDEFYMQHIAMAMAKMDYEVRHGGHPIHTGSEAKDRTIANSLYAIFGTVKAVWVGTYLYSVLCQGVNINGRVYGGRDNPSENTKIATAIFFTNIIGSSYLYRLWLYTATGQK